VQVFTGDGTYVTKWGTAGSGDGQFNNPSGIAVNGSGYVFVADAGNNRVQVFTGDGTYVTKWGTAGPENGQFRNPYGVAADGSGNVYVADTSNHRIQKFAPSGAIIPDTIGAFLAIDPMLTEYNPGGWWSLDYNADGAWSGSVIDRGFEFGPAKSTPVPGDWNGDGKTESGYYQTAPAYGIWRLDYNGNRIWEGGVIDRAYVFGPPGVRLVSGDWNKDGKDEIGYSQPMGTYSIFRIDYNGNGRWDGGVIDRAYVFGTPGATPVSGDWNKDGRDEIGCYSGGIWRLDYNGNGKWNGGIIDRAYVFNAYGHHLVTGDWNGDGKDEIGYSDNDDHWRLDYNGNGVWNGGIIDRAYVFDAPEESDCAYLGCFHIPVTGKWS
jgi:hypothetical protein